MSPSSLLMSALALGSVLLGCTEDADTNAATSYPTSSGGPSATNASTLPNTPGASTNSSPTGAPSANGTAATTTPVSGPGSAETSVSGTTTATSPNGTASAPPQPTNGQSSDDGSSPSAEPSGTAGMGDGAGGTLGEDDGVQDDVIPPATDDEGSGGTPDDTSVSEPTDDASADDDLADESSVDEATQPDANVDVFGITKLYPSAASGAEWSSTHWTGNGPYPIEARTDSNDPTQLSGMRGTGTLQVTGDGQLIFGGSQPRIYVHPTNSGPWQNVEITAYYQRITDDDTAWGGLVIGARSGVEGHGNDPCDAHTYYARLRHDGSTDFEKELMHTPSATRSSLDASQVWPPDGQVPRQTWIGFKYVIYNPPGQGTVKLESYRDMTEGAGGGSWTLLNEAVDAGDWASQTSCDEHAPVDGQSSMIQLDGGVCFIRNTGVTEARYRWFSVREIAP